LVRIEDIFGRGVLGDKIVIGNSTLPAEPPATVADMIAAARPETSSVGPI
jgi:hypothetical protein